jgi:hypothetical protein
MRPNVAQTQVSGTFKQLRLPTDHGRSISKNLFANFNGGDYRDAFDVIGELPRGPVIASGSALDNSTFWNAWAQHYGIAGSYGSQYPKSISTACQAAYVIGNVTSNDQLLKSIITRDCERAGVASTYLSFDSGFDALYVTGRFDAGGTKAGERIEQLARIYLFDVAEYDGKINFITRSVAGASPTAISYDEFGANTPGAEKIERMEVERGYQAEFPRLLTLLYLDDELNFEQNSQQAERRDAFANGEQLEKVYKGINDLSFRLTRLV